MMTKYMLGIPTLEKLAVYPEEYNAANMLYGLGGAVAGGVAGGYGGREIAKALGRETRTNVLGIPVPYTGYGEKFFGTPHGPIIGTALGALGGSVIGSGMGSAAGSLLSINRGAPPRRLVHPNNAVDPELMAYLQQPSHV